MQKRHVMPNRLSRSEAADVGLVARLQTFVQSDWGLLGGVVVLYSNIPAVSSCWGPSPFSFAGCVTALGH
jgi:hypothetical protein